MHHVISHNGSCDLSAIQGHLQYCNTGQYVTGQLGVIVSLYNFIITVVSRTGKFVGFAEFKGASG